MDDGPRPAVAVAAPVAPGLANGLSHCPRPRQGERDGDGMAAEASEEGVAPVRDRQGARRGTKTESRRVWRC